MNSMSAVGRKLTGTWDSDWPSRGSGAELEGVRNSSECEARAIIAFSELLMSLAISQG